MTQLTNAQENDVNSELTEDEYQDFFMADRIIIYGERPETETMILDALNGSFSERRNLIQNELLKNAGFRGTGNARFRKTNTSEKAQYVFGMILRGITFGIINPPELPIDEIEYEKLPRGHYYSFESVLIASEFRNISRDVFNVLKLEYLLQIQFGNGIVISTTINYYTEENITNFENLIISLPDTPEDIGRIKERFLNTELPRIKRAFDRYSNPSEDYMRAMENLRNSFIINE